MSTDQPWSHRPNLAELHMMRQAMLGQAAGARITLDTLLIKLYEMCRRHRRSLPADVADAVARVDDADATFRARTEQAIILGDKIEEARQLERSERDRLDRVERER